eukprot:gene17990-36714_t
MRLDFDHGGMSVDALPIFDAIHSEEFRSSLLNSIAVAIPVTVDYLSEIFITSNIWENGRFQRGLLLMSMWLTDAVILAEVIPNENVAFLVCIFHMRNAIITFAVLKHLKDYGSSVFRAQPISIALFFFMTGHVLICMSAFKSQYHQELFFAFLGCFFIAFIILWILVFKWLLQIFKFSTYGLSERLASDRNIIIILIPALMFGMNYTIICILYGGSINANTTSSFLIEFTYAEAAFMVVIFMIQGRTSRLETIRAYN